MSTPVTDVRARLRALLALDDDALQTSWHDLVQEEAQDARKASRRHGRAAAGDISQSWDENSGELWYAKGPVTRGSRSATTRLKREMAIDAEVVRGSLGLTAPLADGVAVVDAVEAWTGESWRHWMTRTSFDRDGETLDTLPSVLRQFVLGYYLRSGRLWSPQDLVRVACAGRDAVGRKPLPAFVARRLPSRLVRRVGDRGRRLETGPPERFEVTVIDPSANWRTVQTFWAAVGYQRERGRPRDGAADNLLRAIVRREGTRVSWGAVAKVYRAEGGRSVSSEALRKRWERLDRKK